MANQAEAQSGKTLKIKLVKSPIGYNEMQKKTVKALGLHRLHEEIVRPDNAAVRGMINAIQHLVEVTE